ncbi:hypothetical protein BJV82DRAFT_672344 [Fennellomyces sp. T-0311]|nr:hypothetical protein BJV82DRAFT_672344 [Fennellomyces sp. T-0311]
MDQLAVTLTAATLTTVTMMLDRSLVLALQIDATVIHVPLAKASVDSPNIQSHPRCAVLPCHDHRVPRSTKLSVRPPCKHDDGSERIRIREVGGHNLETAKHIPELPQSRERLLSSGFWQTAWRTIWVIEWGARIEEATDESLCDLAASPCYMGQLAVTLTAATLTTVTMMLDRSLVLALQIDATVIHVPLAKASVDSPNIQSHPRCAVLPCHDHRVPRSTKLSVRPPCKHDDGSERIRIREVGGHNLETAKHIPELPQSRERLLSSGFWQTAWRTIWVIEWGARIEEATDESLG